MKIHINSLWTRASGLFIAVLGIFGNRAVEAADLGVYYFTPEAKYPCNYTDVGCATGVKATGYGCTNTFYNGAPWFCYDMLTKSRGTAYYLPAITPETNWNCSSTERNNGTVKYQDCSKLKGYGDTGWRRAKVRGSSGPVVGVQVYDFSYESAIRIIGCVDSSKNLKGAYAGQYYTGSLSSVTCTTAVYCPTDEFGFVPRPLPRDSVDNISSCFVRGEAVGTDSSGTFTYVVPSGKDTCRCYYGNTYECYTS